VLPAFVIDLFDDWGKELTRQENEKIWTDYLDSLNSFVGTLSPEKLSAPVNDSSYLSGKFLVWASKQNEGHLGDQHDTQRSNGHLYGWFQSRKGQVPYELNLNFYQHKNEEHVTKKVKSLVLVESKIHETQMYKFTHKTTIRKRFLGPDFRKTEKLFGQQPFEVKSYLLKAWIFDLATGKLTGYKEFTPDPLPESSEARDVNRENENKIPSWLNELYSSFQKKEKG